MRWVILFCVILWIQNTGATPPPSPTGVRVVYRDASFIVTWKVPPQSYGAVTQYVVLVTILPDNNQTIYRTELPMLILDAGTHIGKMFHLTVSAENKDGLSTPSKPFYIRSPCGESLNVTPASSVRISSPGFPDFIDRGVSCQWNIHTNDTHLLHYHFLHFDLEENNRTETDGSCNDAFIGLSREGGSAVRICQNRTDMLGSSKDAFYFSSGMKRKNITGFQVLINTKVKPPGPPTNVKMKSSKMGVIITWSPPIGRYLPLTSYTLQYRLPNYRREIVLSPHIGWFSINTEKFRGQLLQLSIYANISDTKGLLSRQSYFRVPCGAKLQLPTSRGVQIMSPGYPGPYPPGISCTWEVENPSRGNMSVTLVHMDIEDSLSCSSDYLTLSVGDGARRCGKTTRPLTLTTSDKSVRISFLSDYRRQGHGFLIKVKRIEHPILTSTQRTVTSVNSLTSTKIVYIVKTEDLKSEPTSGETTNEVTSSTMFENKGTSSSQKSLSSTLTQTATITGDQSKSSNSNIITTISKSSSISSPLSSSSSSSASSSSSKTHSPTPHLSTLQVSSTSVSTSPSSSSSSQSSSSPSSSFASSPSSSPFSHSSTSEQTLSVPNETSSIQPTEIIGNRIEDAVHNISVNLEFVRKRRLPKQRQSSNDSLSSLHDRLYDTFNSPFGILKDVALQIIQKDTLRVVLILMYSVPKLLMQMKMDADFRLVRFINETAMTNLSKDHILLDNWKLNLRKLSQFLSTETFYNQEIISPCALVVGYCANNSACAVDTTTKFGIVCRRDDFNSPSSSIEPTRKHDLTFVIAGSSAAAVIIFLLLIALIICRKCPKRHLAVTQHQPFNDILLHSRYIGDKNVEFTAFTSKDLKNNRRRKKQAISVSLPSRTLKPPDTNGVLVEEKLKQLEFIEDQKALKKRLQIKYRSRRTSSL